MWREDKHCFLFTITCTNESFTVSAGINFDFQWTLSLCSPFTLCVCVQVFTSVWTWAPGPCWLTSCAQRFGSPWRSSSTFRNSPGRQHSNRYLRKIRDDGQFKDLTRKNPRWLTFTGTCLNLTYWPSCRKVRSFLTTGNSGMMGGCTLWLLSMLRYFAMLRDGSKMSWRSRNNFSYLLGSFSHVLLNRATEARLRPLKTTKNTTHDFLNICVPHKALLISLNTSYRIGKSFNN